MAIFLGRLNIAFASAAGIFAFGQRPQQLVFQRITFGQKLIIRVNFGFACDIIFRRRRIFDGIGKHRFQTAIIRQHRFGLAIILHRGHLGDIVIFDGFFVISILVHR